MTASKVASKRALISGITGQTGSYLAEYLLGLGYEVHGLIRRASSPNYERIKHLVEVQKSIQLHCADLLDQPSLTTIVDKVRPHEVYNLAAQSFVPASWQQPLLTAEVDALGVTRLLEAIRQVGHYGVRFYQASSSEMFGHIREEPQTESTPFYPRSPYGVAKVYGHWITVNYRESYGMYCCSGIAYNHETIRPDCPICVRRNGVVAVVAADEIAKTDALLRTDTDWRSVIIDGHNIEIWDNGKWVRITGISRYIEPNKPTTRLLSRSGYIECTNGHVVCATPDKPIEDFVPGDTVPLPILPQLNDLGLAVLPAGVSADSALAAAWVLGFCTGDGSLHGGRASTTRELGTRLEFFNKDITILNRVEANLKLVDRSAIVVYLPHKSSYKPSSVNHKLRVTSQLLKQLCAECYYQCKPKALKRVPQWILNSSVAVIEAYLDGYCEADGTKSLPHAIYRFQYYTTKSQVLAAGLRLLCHLTGRTVTYSCERRENECSVGYYHKGFVRSRRSSKYSNGRSGFNLMKNPSEVTKVWSDSANEFITITTESGTFSAGTGMLRVHNSPRRGLEFVTRKISTAVANIAAGHQQKLMLGSLSAERDWGFAGDYVAAMHIMLQQDRPDDYVIATGEKHTVREFADLAFKRVGLDYRDHVVVDNTLYRPAEVHTLCGDASKLRHKTGWIPTTNFPNLVNMMVDADVARQK